LSRPIQIIDHCALPSPWHFAPRSLWMAAWSTHVRAMRHVRRRWAALFSTIASSKESCCGSKLAPNHLAVAPYASRLGLDPSLNRFHAPLVYHENYSFADWPEHHTFPVSLSAHHPSSRDKGCLVTPRFAYQLLSPLSHWICNSCSDEQVRSDCTHAHNHVQGDTSALGAPPTTSAANVRFLSSPGRGRRAAAMVVRSH
jgi:hypothetical protein